MVIMANRKHGTPLKVGLYDIGEEIGKGNFASVRFARHRNIKYDVSIIIYIPLFYCSTEAHNHTSWYPYS